jgi:hypothetical protein
MVVANATFRPLYPREREPVLIVQEAGWAPGPVWTGTENLAPTGIQSRSVQSIASRYEGYAITAPKINILISGKLRYPATPFSRRCQIKHILLYTEFSCGVPQETTLQTKETENGPQVPG